MHSIIAVLGKPPKINIKNKTKKKSIVNLKLH